MYQSAGDPTWVGAEPLAIVRSRRLLDTGMFVVLLAVIATAATPWGAREFAKGPVFECVVFALAGLWAIESLATNSWGIFEHRLVLPMIALAAFAFIQSVPFWPAAQNSGLEETTRLAISADPYESRQFAIRLLALALSLGLLIRYTTTRNRYHSLIYMVIGVGLISALLVLIPNAGSFFGISAVTPLGWGLFDNRNHFAFLMAMVIGLMLGLGLRPSVSWRARLFFITLTAPLWVALILTRSRAALLALATEVLLLVIMFGFLSPAANSLLRRRIHFTNSWSVSALFITKLGLAIVFVLALWGSAVWIGGDSLMKRLESVPVEFRIDRNTGGNRMDIWRATWRSFKASPLLGSGLGAYGVAITGYHEASGKWTPQQAHNDYLELLAGSGLIGGVLCIWFAFEFFRRARTRLRSVESFGRAACVGALAGIAAVVVHSLFDFGLHIVTNALVFIALIVIATVGTEDRRRSATV